MATTFKQLYDETRAAAAITAWQRALRASALAKIAPTWAGRRTFYRTKAGAMSVAITALPELLLVADLPADQPGIVGVVLRGLPPGLHVALDLLSPEARTIVQNRIAWQARRDDARASRLARPARRPA